MFIRQDPVTHDIILSRKPATWDGFFDAVRDANESGIPSDFLNAQERVHSATSRDPFEGWQE